MAFPNPRITPSSLILGQIVGDFVYFDDFLTGGYGTTTGPKFASTADVADWLYTEASATSTFIISDAERGGVLTADVGATTDDHGHTAQLNGEAFQVSVDRDIYWEMRSKIRAEVAEVDWVIGLCNTDTTVLAGCNDALVFRSGAVDVAPLNAGTADIIASAGDDMAGSWTDTKISEVDTGINLVADTFNVFAIHLQVRSDSRRRARFFVDGQELLNTTTNIPDDDVALTPTWSIQNTASMAASAKLEIDYIYCAQVRL